MRHAEHKRLPMCNTCTSLLILSLTSLPKALAQESLAVSSTLTTRVFVTMPPAASLEYLSTSVSPITPVIPVQPPLQTYPELFIATEQSPQGGKVKSRVFNYYFLFLAILAVMLAALIWWMHRQKRREQTQIRLRGQHALVRDVERWAMYRRRQAPVVEGLDECGEAPPPYMPKDDTLTTPQHPNDAMDGAVDVAVPPRALSRGDTERIRLPDYSEITLINNTNMGAQTAMLPNETSNDRAGAT